MTNKAAGDNNLTAYRPDDDGLRALAVLSVVAYHAFPNIVKGGFVGVDIFFVISGFLISGVILDSLAQEKFSFFTFYARRIRRIFPALLLVLASVLIFGWFALFAGEYAALGKHVSGGAGFISNILFWREAGYWDASAQVKPLLHLWSLGIEEQFYIIFPCLLFFAWKKNLRILTVILLLLIISFVCNIHYYKRNPVLDFYAPYTRFWELLAGVVIAVSVRCKSRYFAQIKQKIDRVACIGFYEWAKRGDVNNGENLANLLSWLGVILLGLAIATTRADHHFPGYRALLPIFGTAFILAAGQRAWINRLVFSNKSAVATGLISYPLYLWHWPLLSYVYILQGDQSGTWSWFFIRLGCVLLAAILAFFTYRLVERPIRFGPKGKTFKTLALIFLAVCVGCAGFGVHLKDGLPNREINKSRRIAFSHSPNPYVDEAGITYALRHVPAVPREYYDPKLSFIRGTIIPDNKTTVVLLGDSHAYSAYQGIAKRSAELEMNTILMADGAGRSPILGLDNLHDDDYEKNIVFKTTAWINYLCNDDAVKKIFLFHWHGNALRTEFVTATQNVVNILREAGKEVFIVSDWPRLLDDISRYVDRPFSISRYSNQNSKLASAGLLKNYHKYLAVLDSIQGATIIKETAAAFCPGEQCLAFSKEGRSLYTDTNHLSEIGANFLVERVLEPYLVRIAEEAKNAPEK
jgi:peptidoglycan/LPS O-acetylase OafA/YrhL